VISYVDCTHGGSLGDVDEPPGVGRHRPDGMTGPMEARERRLRGIKVIPETGIYGDTGDVARIK
jgi:hypothetical protein